MGNLENNEPYNKSTNQRQSQPEPEGQGVITAVHASESSCFDLVTRSSIFQVEGRISYPIMITMAAIYGTVAVQHRQHAGWALVQ